MPKHNIRLAIETATHACSVALQVGDDVRERFELAPRRHAELLLPWVDELLAEAGVSRSQIDGLVITRGPGSFTSLRLGISVGLAIAFALDRPVYPVSTLAALAWAGHQQAGAAHILAALDARMNEVYVAAYQIDAKHLIPLQDEQLLKPEAYSLPDQETMAKWLGAGNGLSAMDNALALVMAGQLHHVDADIWPRASAALALADDIEAVAAEAFQPVYLRDRVAHERAKAKP